MAGIDFKPTGPQEQEAASVVAHNTRVGLVLFAVYVACYGGYMVLSAFWPALMRHEVLAGVNLAVVYGFGLIGMALLLALIYLKRCITN